MVYLHQLLFKETVMNVLAIKEGSFAHSRGATQKDVKTALTVSISTLLAFFVALLYAMNIVPAGESVLTEQVLVIGLTALMTIPGSVLYLHFITRNRTKPTLQR